MTILCEDLSKKLGTAPAGRPQNLMEWCVDSAELAPSNLLIFRGVHALQYLKGRHVAYNPDTITRKVETLKEINCKPNTFINDDDIKAVEFSAKGGNRTVTVRCEYNHPVRYNVGSYSGEFNGRKMSKGVASAVYKILKRSFDKIQKDSN